MDEQTLRELIEDVRAGRWSRRGFVQAMVALGLTAPMAAQMLASAGVARAQAKNPVFTPTKRGGGGPLRILWWQAPTLLNPHFATGTKDQDASRIFYEPLCSFDPDGNLVPILAQDVPSLQNGGLSKDGMNVTWKLKQGATWHDGKPFTADDVIFTWEYAADTATAAPTVGTGPYRFVDFKPGDVVRGEINSTYHVPNRPYFDTIEMKGGGDAVSAARAVLQTGEYEFGWNMQVEDEILQRLEQNGKGRVEIFTTGGIEHIQCNQTNPWKEVDGERSSPKTSHPFLSDLTVRRALNLLVDRAAVQEQIYGRQGRTTANFLNAPPRVYSKNTRWEFNVDRANALLETAGWARGADGIREKGGRKLRMLYQTSVNAPRQKTQAIVKQAAAKVGIEIELKSVVASVFFSSDAANPDTYPHFYADLQMYNIGLQGTDARTLMNLYVSWEAATKENKWQGRNVTRWRNEEYDRLYRAADTELDPVKRAALFIRMNDLVIQNVIVIPVLWRNGVSAAALKLQGMELSGWDSQLWRLSHWHRQA